MSKREYIYNSKGKTKSVALTDEGLKRAKEVFDGLFGDDK